MAHGGSPRGVNEKRGERDDGGEGAREAEPGGDDRCDEQTWSNMETPHDQKAKVERHIFR